MYIFKLLPNKSIRTALIASLSVACVSSFSTAIFVDPAHAAKRMKSTQLSCNQIQSMLRSKGQIYLWEPKAKAVTRFVGNAVYCDVNRSMRYTSVRSKDKQYCRVTQCSGSDLNHDHSRGRHGGRHHGHGHGRY